MERIRDYGTLAVLGRFMRRRWRTPAKIAGVSAGVLALSGFSFFVPRPKVNRDLTFVKAPGAASSGVVESLRQKGVGSPFEGVLKRVAVSPGASVKKGDVLFTMDTTGYEMELQRARAGSQGARQALEAAYTQRRADLQQHESEVAAARAALRSARQVPVAEAQPAAEEYTLVGDQLAPIAAPQVVTPDTSAEEARLSAALQQLEQRKRDWEPTLQVARESVAAADREVSRLKQIIAGGVRRSPLSGVVTALYGKPGEYVTANRPLVRVDDPKSYRVVTIVDQKVRERLKPGMSLKLASADGGAAGKLEKIESGWDRDVFHYYLWVKPASTKTLQPGEAVSVQLPATMMAVK